MKFVKILFILFIISIAALGGVSYWIYSSVNKPHQHDKANQFIIIPKGSTPTEIIDKLSAEGVIASSMPTLANNWSNWWHSNQPPVTRATRSNRRHLRQPTRGLNLDGSHRR